MSATVCLMLAATLHCQDVSMAMRPGTHVTDGAGARLCITYPGYLNCQNISQQDATELIRDENCTAAQLETQTAQRGIKSAQEDAEKNRRWAVKSPQTRDLHKQWEKRARETVADQRLMAELSRQSVARWCTTDTP